MPVFVFDFFDPFDPVIGNSHAHSKIKSNASFFKRIGQCRHTAYVFGNCNGIGIAIVYQFIGQTQVCDGILVLVAVKVMPVFGKGPAETMIVIHHGSNSVKTEPVQTVFFQPVFYVGKKKMHNGALAVIKTTGRP